MGLTERRERRKGPEDNASGFISAALAKVERDAKQDQNEVRYFDKDQGIWVSIQFGDEQTRAKGLSRIRQLYDRKVSRNRSKISVLILETPFVQDPTYEVNVLGGVLVQQEEGSGTGKNGVESFQVTRDASQFPNFSHMPPPPPVHTLNQEEYKRYAEVINGLEPGHVIRDTESSRTASEMEHDRLLASDFVHWVENVHFLLHADNELAGNKLPDPETISLGDELSTTHLMTFIPDKIEGKCVLLVQQKVADVWLITEYMVDREEENRRVYKSYLATPVVQVHLGAGDIWERPPFPNSESISPNTAQKDTLEGERSITKLMRDGNKVFRPELDNLVGQAREKIEAI